MAGPVIGGFVGDTFGLSSRSRAQSGCGRDLIGYMRKIDRRKARCLPDSGDVKD